MLILIIILDRIGKIHLKSLREPDAQLLDHQPLASVNAEAALARFARSSKDYRLEFLETALGYINIKNHGSLCDGVTSGLDLKGCNADIWLILGTEVADKTYKDLQRFSNFKSYKEKRVYACNTTKTSFFDEIPFHPERLLKDLYVIFHSEKYDDVNEYLHYYRKLAE